MSHHLPVKVRHAVAAQFEPIITVGDVIVTVAVACGLFFLITLYMW
jgi:hypothetical protein